MTAVVRVKYKFEKGISVADQKKFKAKLQQAVNQYAHNKAELIPVNGNGRPIPIRVILQESNSYHKIVDVEKHRNRDWVGSSDINVKINDRVRTLAHEFFHLLGNYDEYNGGKLENHAYWHDNKFVYDQNQALMGVGSQVRDRYFDHFAKKVSQLMGTTYVPRLTVPQRTYHNLATPSMITVPKVLPSPKPVIKSPALEKNRTPVFSSTLRMGMQGKDIRSLQQALNNRFGTGLKQDGIFGLKTRNAVINIQKLFNVRADGIVGHKTSQIFRQRTPILKFGMRSSAVSNLQKNLNNRFGTGLKQDGVFGPKTQAALKNVQGMYGLKREGIFGQKTSLAISSEPRIIKIGLRGNYVRGLQQNLNNRLGMGLKEDGIFGPKTRTAVRSTQSMYGLKRDGIFGPHTRNAIENHTPHTVMFGSHGVGVSTLQTMLNRRGAGLKVDGMFGPKTQGAVRQFQMNNGLRVDGIIGRNSWAKLMGR
ncbi:peptidoglycan-binding protein [Candidatus Woesearchaeota archaeon]|nr:peptidoglycan-binding protein [Candidatus Woesearchaeota archaeon]